LDSIYLATVDNGSWRASFGMSLARLMSADTATTGLIGQVTREHVPAGDLSGARNRVARKFVDSGLDYLLMLDSDMAFGPDLHERLLAAAKVTGAPAAGGLCFTATSTGGLDLDIAPSMYAWTGIDGTKERGFTAVTEYERGSLCRCDGTGAACLLVSREAMLTVTRSEPTSPGPFDLATIPGIGPDGAPRTFSEDLSFCLRLGAAGFPIVVATSINVDHDKGIIVLNEEAFLAQQARKAKK
jgi:hypothetical protein